MKLPKETPTKHSCLHCFGRATHVSTSTHSGKVFCGYCQKQLTKEQANPKWAKLFEVIKERY